MHDTTGKQRRERASAGGDSGVAVKRDTTLGQACEIIMGTSPPGDTYNTTGDGVPLINGPVEFSPGSFGKTIRSKFTTAPNKRCRAGDLIVCVRGSTTGRMNIAAFDACIGRGVAAIRAKEYQPFINYFVRSKRQDIYDLGTGATFPNISSAALGSLRLSLPPLPEQQRIVGILDEAFAGIATAKANAEKNLRNAREAFESELQAIFHRGGDGWVKRTLGELAEFKNGLNFNQSSRGQSVRVVGVGDFQNNYNVPTSELQSVTIDGKLDQTYEIREGDLLTVRSNGSKDLVGRCMLVPAIDGVISYSGFVIRIRCDKSVIVPRFLLHFMKSSATREQLTRGGGGTNISNINQGKLSALSLAIPKPSVQRAVIEKLDRLVENSQRLERIYQQKLAALDALKKSLLHQAFSGQLTGGGESPVRPREVQRVG